MNRTTSVRLTHIDFFTSAIEHTFHYFIEPANGAAFPLAVHVVNIEGMDALVQRGHETLITILRDAIGQLEKIKGASSARQIEIDAGGERPGDRPR